MVVFLIGRITSASQIYSITWRFFEINFDDWFQSAWNMEGQLFWSVTVKVENLSHKQHVLFYETLVHFYEFPGVLAQVVRWFLDDIISCAKGRLPLLFPKSNRFCNKSFILIKVKLRLTFNFKRFCLYRGGLDELAFFIMKRTRWSCTQNSINPAFFWE